MIKIFCLVFVLSVCTVVSAQTIFEKIQDNVGLLRYQYKDTSGKLFTFIGTGTIISKAVKDNSGKAFVFVITNKHVLPNFNRSRSIEFCLNNPDSSKERYTKFKIPVYQNDGTYDPHILVSPDEDLAIIDIGDAYANTGFNLIPNRHIPIEILADKKMLHDKEIGIGDLIYFQGYPSFFYDKDNFTPILRTGYLATDPAKQFHFNEYLKKSSGRDILNGFLIDANAFGGSSGSLVCLYPTLITHSYLNHPILDNVKSEPCILGILTDSYYDVSSKIPETQRLNLGG